VAYLLPNFAEQELVEGEELGSNILRVSQRSLAPQGALAPPFWETVVPRRHVMKYVRAARAARSRI
jgi:hypothetical protein